MEEGRDTHVVSIGSLALQMGLASTGMAIAGKEGDDGAIVGVPDRLVADAQCAVDGVRQGDEQCVAALRDGERGRLGAGRRGTARERCGERGRERARGRGRGE